MRIFALVALALLCQCHGATAADERAPNRAFTTRIEAALKRPSGLLIERRVKFPGAGFSVCAITVEAFPGGERVAQGALLVIQRKGGPFTRPGPFYADGLTADQAGVYLDSEDLAAFESALAQAAAAIERGGPGDFAVRFRSRTSGYFALSTDTRGSWVFRLGVDVENGCEEDDECYGAREATGKLSEVRAVFRKAQAHLTTR